MQQETEGKDSVKVEASENKEKHADSLNQVRINFNNKNYPILGSDDKVFSCKMQLY